MVDDLKDFPTDLGNILVRMGALTWEQLHLITEKKHWNPNDKIGELLLKDGMVDESTLKEALELQRSLRTSEGVPVEALHRLFNHAVESYQRNNLRLALVLDSQKR